MGVKAEFRLTAIGDHLRERAGVRSMSIEEIDILDAFGEAIRAALEAALPGAYFGYSSREGGDRYEYVAFEAAGDFAPETCGPLITNLWGRWLTSLTAAVCAAIDDTEDRIARDPDQSPRRRNEHLGGGWRRAAGEAGEAVVLNTIQLTKAGKYLKMRHGAWRPFEDGEIGLIEAFGAAIARAIDGRYPEIMRLSAFSCVLEQDEDGDVVMAFGTAAGVEVPADFDEVFASTANRWLGALNAALRAAIGETEDRARAAASD